VDDADNEGAQHKLGVLVQLLFLEGILDKLDILEAVVDPYFDQLHCQ
jgi:hypothetical protein